MLIPILGIFIVVVTILGVIKPELIIRKKNLNGSEEQNQKK